MPRTGGGSQQPKVVITAEHASAQFGGEAALPLHYFRILRERGIETWLVVHERTREELLCLLPEEAGRIVYVSDTTVHRWLWKMSRRLPDRIANFTVGFAMRLLSQAAQWRRVRALVRAHGIDVVHQPIPVSPREPSLMFALGAPVVIGPMNGGIDFPPAFRHMQSRATRVALRMGRCSATALNLVMPGKSLAHTLLVANTRTRQALPSTVSRRVIELVENGVDLKTWRLPDGGQAKPAPRGRAEFVFLGRLVDWKAVDLLLQAFEQARARYPMTLSIIGEGVERERLEALAQGLGLYDPKALAPSSVRFLGWQTQAECAKILSECTALVLPSLMECGGAVVLEAMAMGKAVIATNWGGPADYLDTQSGILIAPDTALGFTSAFADAMVTLASDPDTCDAMGRHGQHLIKTKYDWQVKIDNILEIYRSVAFASP